MTQKFLYKRHSIFFNFTLRFDLIIEIIVFFSNFSLDFCQSTQNWMTILIPTPTWCRHKCSTETEGFEVDDKRRGNMSYIIYCMLTIHQSRPNYNRRNQLQVGDWRGSTFSNERNTKPPYLFWSIWNQQNRRLFHDVEIAVQRIKRTYFLLVFLG